MLEASMDSGKYHGPFGQRKKRELAETGQELPRGEIGEQVVQTVRAGISRR
jgi:hypothetical protein